MSRADPIATQRKETSGSNSSDNPQKYYAGNLQLMEARFLELSSNIRALNNSNQQLKEELEEADDPDFRMAIDENAKVIRKKRREILDVVVDMKRMGANIDVPDDIQTMQDTAIASSVTTTATVVGSGQGERSGESGNRADESDEGLYL